jgi:hypothetical protein
VVRTTRLAITLAGGCLIGFAASIVLTRLHADAGWYYGLAILLTGIVGLRTLAPEAGISIDDFHRQGQTRREKHEHLPNPLA